MESAHPSTSCPSPLMHSASPSLSDTQVATSTDIAAAAATQIPFESIGL
jgi:hypothetical protein